ncbi:MAG: tripartite tricarboxylate transporter substrate binding protein [Rhodospirillaceae bacterium]|jgi:tripartite-type tricarboxylate transporter receptor subunit TctC
MKSRTKVVVASVMGIGGLAVMTAGEALADKFPTKPIRYVLHSSAGGGTDRMARLLAPIAAKHLGQKVIVQNMKGGGGAKQMGYLTKGAKADGYTIGSTTGSLIGRMNTVFKGRFGVKDFTWVTGLLQDPFVFAVPTDSPAKDLKSFVKMINSNPGKHKIAGFAVGGAQWIAWNIFANGVGFKPTNAVWVPYTSMGPAAVATVGKHADMTVNFVGVTLQHARAKNLRYLAIMSTSPSPAIPKVPTIHQAGYPKVDSTFVQFRGLVAPKGVPADRLAKVNAAFIKAMKSERVTKWLNKTGKTLMNYGPKRFTKFAHHVNKVTAQYVKDLDPSVFKKKKKKKK